MPKPSKRDRLVEAAKELLEEGLRGDVALGGVNIARGIAKPRTPFRGGLFCIRIKCLTHLLFLIVRYCPWLTST
jgi:hypothetical protein